MSFTKHEIAREGGFGAIAEVEFLSALQDAFGEYQRVVVTGHDIVVTEGDDEYWVSFGRPEAEKGRSVSCFVIRLKEPLKRAEWPTTLKCLAR